MPELSRDQILNIFDKKILPIPVPEWGGTTHLRVMSSKEALEFWSYIQKDEKDGKSNGAYLLTKCICDSKGNRLFGDTEDDFKALLTKAATVINQLALAALELNGMGEKAKKEMRGNCATPSSASS